MKQKWCRQYGLQCKDENCKFEHLNKPPKICNAILNFPDNKFAMCEYDLGHIGDHRALMFEWRKENEYMDNSYWLRGLQLLKAKMGLFK
ncbi:MAG: hypothetical protein AABY22_12050 [Nanoarchaeota archaeon]